MRGGWSVALRPSSRSASPSFSGGRRVAGGSFTVMRTRSPQPDPSLPLSSRSTSRRGAVSPPGHAPGHPARGAEHRPRRGYGAAGDRPLDTPECDIAVVPEPPERISALSSYVPQAVLRHLASSAGAGPQPTAERYPAALLLVDLTGFTALTASAVRRGPAGTEGLSRSLNTYLGQIIDLAAAHGGDVAKILGDALLIVWPAADGDLPAAARRAATCGLSISAELADFELSDDLQLSLKVGVCAGEVAATHVGGLDGRWLFVVAGDGVSQLTALEEQMRAGDVAVSPQAWRLLADRFVSLPLDDGHVRIRPSGSGQPDTALRPLPLVDLGAESEAAVRAYIPPVALARLDAGQAG